MLMHCFWLLEFKFAFEFKCLIFSLNLSKFRSLEKAPDLSLLKAQPSYRCLAAEVRWRSSDFRPGSLRRPSRPSSGPASAHLLRAGPRSAFPSLAVADRWGPPVIFLRASSPRRTRARVRAGRACPRAVSASPCLARTPRSHPRPYLRSRHPWQPHTQP